MSPGQAAGTDDDSIGSTLESAERQGASGDVARAENVPVILRVVRVVAAGGTRASTATERRPDNLTYLPPAYAENTSN
jgi:hypothetical protein